MAGKALRFKPVFRGESKTYEFTVVDDNDQPQDITYADSIDFAINYPVGPPFTPIILKTLTAGVTIVLPQTGANKGKFRVTLDPADTAAVDPLDYRADAWMVKSGIRSCVVPPSVWSLKDPVTSPT